MSDFGGLFEGLHASTEQEIEARAAAYELKILARSQCSLCDNYGYLTWMPMGSLCGCRDLLRVNVSRLTLTGRGLSARE